MKKADEMEIAINLKACRNAWVFLVVAIMAFSLVETITTGELPLMFLFGTISGVIFSLTKLIETKEMTKQSEEDEE